ncbi:MAG: ankyrin repeat domain-containing protein, partial [Spirochaetales bacterium]
TAEHIVFFASNGADVHASDNNSITPLIRSFDAGLDMTKQLINAQNINTRDSFGNTPLYIAVERNTDLEQIQFLVSMGADVNARNKSGHSALYIAVENNNRAVGEYLLANNADVFSSDDNQSSPLSLALSKGGFVQEWFLTSQVIQSSDGLGDTPLHYAAKRELNNAIFALLERGANPNAQNTNGENPLFHAAKANSIDTVRLLSENGTNQNARDYLGSTVLHTCVQWDSQDVAVYLIENGIDINAQNLSGKTALHQAARTGRFDMVNLLLRAGANIHAADSMGRTPLMDAIAAENITIVSLLIDNGASISIPEMYGRNAYHEAVETANIELIEILRNAGGNALGRDTNGQTPLSLVLNTNSELIFAVLGNDIHLADSDGNTPLHIAVINGAATDIVAELIDAGYSANRRNSEGATALLLAVKNGNITLAQMFLEHDADPFISDNSGNSALIYALKNNAAMLNTIVQEVGNKQDIAGETVLHYAAREADVGTVQRLLSMGLDRTIKNISGETAYNIALRWEKNDIAALLQ